MDKQRALAALHGVVRTIPVSDTTQIVDIARKTEAGNNYKTFDITPPDWKEAVDLIIKKVQWGYVGRFYGSPFVPLALPEEALFCYILDGDVELFIVCPIGTNLFLSSGFDENNIRQVKVRRRQALTEKHYHLLALRIRQELRNVLPANVDIIAAEGGYVLITPRGHWITGRQGSHIEERFIKEFDKLTQHFTDSWTTGHGYGSVALVYRVPKEQSTGLSRSEKTLHIHKVYASDPVVAGFAEEFIEYQLDIARAEGAATVLHINSYNTKNQALRNSPTPFYTSIIITGRAAIEKLRTEVLPLLGI